ncbi:hypothetical protein D3C85_1717500 [compost metagenome]
MHHVSVPSAEVGVDQCVLGRRLHLVPLLQLDDHDVLRVVVAATSQADVDALGTLRDMKFNGHADVIRNFGVAEDLRHVAKRLLP